jgi:fucose 4-O-acetylase-like acetyltransferase
MVTIYSFAVEEPLDLEKIMNELQSINKSAYREIVIDSLKGFAILLVIIGHSIQVTTNNDFTSLPFRFIYSFHMPLFMFLSGYVTVYSPTNNWKSVKKRFFRLVIPFFSWAVVSFIIYCYKYNKLDFQYWTELIKEVDNGLWFLWVLFLIHIVFYINEKIAKSMALYSLFIIAIVLQLIPSAYYVLGFGFVKLYFIFFVFGYAMNNEMVHSFVARNKLILFCLFSGLFLYLFQYWTFHNNLDFIKEDFGITNRKLFRISGVLYRFIVPFCAIIAIYTLFHIHIFFKDKLDWLGKNTNEIYTSHVYFIQLIVFLFAFAGLNFMVIEVVVAFIIGLSFSISLAYLVKKSETMASLLYGTKTIN